MLSRVAESVYWMSRYIERAENVARFVYVNYNLTLGDDAPLGEQWAPLVYTTGDHQDFDERYKEATRENVLKFLLFDAKNPNSILSCVASAREAARTVREVLTTSLWEQLNRFHLLVRKASESGEAIEQPYDFCETVRMTSSLLIGIIESAMLHDEAWSFAELGRYIERADKTSRIVDVQYFLLLPKVQDVGTSIDIIRWSSLLKSADALAMYRRTHGRIVPEKVAAFLILNAIFPRSIRFCVSRAEQCLASIRSGDPQRGELTSAKLARQLSSKIESITIDQIIQQGMHDFIDHLQGVLNALGTAVYGDYFNTQTQLQRFVGQKQQMGTMVQHQT